MTNIKIVSDFACPFCYVGFAFAEKLKKEYPNVNIEYIPFELNPDLGPEGQALKDKMTEKQLKEAYIKIRKLGDEYGLIYGDNPINFNTHKLHMASLYARDVGKSSEFKREAFKALLEREENVSEDVVINDIGLKAGLNIVEMKQCLDSGKYEEEMEDAAQLAKNHYQIQLVPSFIIDDKRLLDNLKPYEEFKKEVFG